MIYFTRPIQLQEVQSKAKQLQPEGFTASKGWLYRFLKRNRFSTRRATAVGQSIPSSAGLLAQIFFSEVAEIVSTNSK